ncbi:MAG: type I-U CRISPR-associated protein Cas5/Cas6 [Boseongicola sp. SB0662_bin_57]|nr:type I-U CRISPR-associated protein Cas5/Cas6 [Boseongicola sp. SB0662_bin_57]
MSLVLEIEFLTGVCRASRGPGSNAPDWPPQPDRVFSALVSAWGVRGEAPVERAALEWLEGQPPPVIHASGHNPRTAPDVFVPPNDLRASKATKTYLKVLPDRRPRQPRRFPATRPDDPKVELVWPDAPDAGTVDALNAIAGCVGYLGHSASLARCRFVPGETRGSHLGKQRARRRVYPGRLIELEEAHRARPSRPEIRPGAPVFAEHAPLPETATEWLVLEAVSGEVPDIRASALVGRLLRQTLMAGYRRVGRGDAIPEIVSGHAPDGTPTRHPHLAIAPMAFVGSPHGDGRVLGFAVVPPSGEALHRIDGFRAAFEVLAPFRADVQRRVLTLQGPPLRKPLELAPAAEHGDRLRSLRPDPYLDGSRRWATVTPIVLDRHLKRKEDTEVRELVARACQHAGLPRPDIDRIRVGKHSAVKGAPPARPLAGEPPWTRWKLPRSLESRQLVHAVIEFERSVGGPVLIGAGRFNGLGLCRGAGN